MLKTGIYKHYKGPLYKVYAICRHSETEEPLVFYRSLYGDFDLWVRPLSMFCSMVEVDGKTMKRFTWQETVEDVLLNDKARLEQAFDL